MASQLNENVAEVLYAPQAALASAEAVRLKRELEKNMAAEREERNRDLVKRGKEDPRFPDLLRLSFAEIKRAAELGEYTATLPFKCQGKEVLHIFEAVADEMKKHHYKCYNFGSGQLKVDWFHFQKPAFSNPLM